MKQTFRAIGFLIFVSFLFPGFAYSNNHNPSGLCTDNEIAVALQEGPTNSRLRYYKIQNRAIIERAIADIPVRVESIDIGDVYGNGYNSLVAGLFHTYPGSLGAVRVYTKYPESDTWTEDVLGHGILNNVEAIEIGDANNDGRNDVIIGLEYNIDIPSSRIKIFSYIDGAWVSEDVSPVSWQYHVQYVEVKDIDADGEKEIIALTSKSYFDGPYPRVQVVVFKKIDGTWSMNQIYAAGVLVEPWFLTEWAVSDRMNVKNLDFDPELEVVFGVSFSTTTLLYKLDQVADSWVPTVLASVHGLIDGIDIGDITGDGEDDILFSYGSRDNDDSRVSLLERSGLDWIEVNPGGNDPYRFIYDTSIGDLNNDGENDGIFAAGPHLYQIFRTNDGAFRSSLLVDTGVWIDSAQIGDVDNVVHDLTPDIFTFLTAWFAGEDGADFNGDGVIDVSDIFAFLTAWYARC